MLQEHRNVWEWALESILVALKVLRVAGVALASLVGGLVIGAVAVSNNSGCGTAGRVKVAASEKVEVVQATLNETRVQIRKRNFMNGSLGHPAFLSSAVD